MKFQTKVICEASKWERERAGGRGRESVWCCRLRWQPISSLLECTPKSNPAATTICGLKILNCWNLKTDFSARNWSSARKTTRRRRKKPASREKERERKRRKEGNCRRDSARHEPVAMFAIRFGATQTEDWDSDSPLSLQLRLRNLDDNEAENLRQRRFKRKKLKLENSLELLSWKLAPDPGPHVQVQVPAPLLFWMRMEECGEGRSWCCLVCV